jgi:hypothetical protein
LQYPVNGNGTTKNILSFPNSLKLNKRIFGNAKKRPQIEKMKPKDWKEVGWLLNFYCRKPATREKTIIDK